MSRYKKLYILLGVLVIACVSTLAAMKAEERKEQIKISGEVILELPSESVQSLSWEYNGESLSFHREEAWLYDGDEAFPVSEEKISGLLEPFQSFGAEFTIAEVEDYGQYGLDRPICTINLSTADQTYVVQLGDYSKMDAQRYVSIGDGNVYLVRHDPLEEFDAVLSDMIDHDEIPPFDHVTRVQFAGAEAYSITYQENSADSYSAGDVYFTQRGSKNLPLDTSKVNSYLRNIAELNPSDYVSYNATAEQLQAYGLDAPELTITVDYTVEGEDGEEAEDTFVLYVSPDPEAVKAAEEAERSGREAEIPAYIRLGQSQIIYKVSSSSYKKLAAASYNDLRHSEVLWADFADVQEIAISLEGDDYTLTSEKDGDKRTWSYQDQDELDLSGFQSALNRLTADSFTEEQPAQKEEISLTVYLDNQNFLSTPI